MPDPQDFLCLITFDEPGLFHPWFEWLRLLAKCSRFTAALTQWFAFISLLGSDWSSFCTHDRYKLHCTKNRASDRTCLCKKGKMKKKWLISHKAGSLNISFADTQLFQFNSEAYWMPPYPYRSSHSMQKDWNYERQGVCLKPRFSLGFRESLWCFPLYTWAFQHSEKEVQDSLCGEWRSDCTVTSLVPVLEGMI